MAGVMEIDERALAAKFEVILPHLDERQRRLLLAAEARSLGYGGHLAGGPGGWGVAGDGDRRGG